jgi:hypothetical protein
VGEITRGFLGLQLPAFHSRCSLKMSIFGARFVFRPTGGGPAFQALGHSRQSERLAIIRGLRFYLVPWVGGQCPEDKKQITSRLCRPAEVGGCRMQHLCALRWQHYRRLRFAPTGLLTCRPFGAFHSCFSPFRNEGVISFSYVCLPVQLPLFVLL